MFRENVMEVALTSIIAILAFVLALVIHRAYEAFGFELLMSGVAIIFAFAVAHSCGLRSRRPEGIPVDTLAILLDTIRRPVYPFGPRQSSNRKFEFTGGNYGLQSI